MIAEEDTLEFFRDVKDCYAKESQEFTWEFDDIRRLGDDILFYLSFNLSKNILHGPLPSNLHARMIFNKNPWSKRYFDYLEGK
mgnify:CR=1 FL=1